MSSPSDPRHPPCPPTPPLLPTAPTPPPHKDRLVDQSSSSRKKAKKKGAAAAEKDQEVVVPARCSSPDPNCAICLGDLENMSYTDSCFHKFCFTCLLEWSKVRAVCPLCKAKFKSIIHTIRSDDNYESYTLPPPPTPPPAISITDIVRNMTAVGGAGPAFGFDRRFLYHAMDDHRLLLERPNAMEGYQLPSLPPDHFSNIPLAPSVLSRRRRGGPATSDFRRHIYESSQYVEAHSVADVTGRYRECSPQWYRSNPAQTHRLVPWLNRELNATLVENHHQSSYLIQLILDLIQRHEIRSQEIHDRLLPYLANRTDHFQHEFYNFARSVYDMVGFDRHARYSTRHQSLPAATRPQQEPSASSSTAAAAATADAAMIPTAATTFVVSSGSEDSSDIEVIGEIRRPSRQQLVENLTERMRRRLQRYGHLGPTIVATPVPASTSLAAAATATQDVPMTVMDGPSTSSGEASSNITRLVIPDMSSSDDDHGFGRDDAVEVLDIIPARQQQRRSSFDVIHLSSDDEVEEGEIATRESKAESVQIDISSEEQELVISNDSGAGVVEEMQQEQHQIPEASASGRRKRSRSEWRRQMEIKRRRRWGTSSSSSSSSSSSRSGDSGDRRKMSRSKSPSLRKLRKEEVSNKGKGKGKGKRSVLTFPQVGDVKREEQDKPTPSVAVPPSRIVKLAPPSPLPSSSPEAATVFHQRRFLILSSDDDEEDVKPLAQKFSRTKKAAMDQNPLEEYKVESICETDLRLKILNRRYRHSDLSSRLEESRSNEAASAAATACSSSSNTYDTTSTPRLSEEGGSEEQDYNNHDWGFAMKETATKIRR